MEPPKFSYDAGQMQIDWRQYDAEVGPFLDGVAIPEGEPLQGARATSVEIRTPKPSRPRSRRRCIGRNGPSTSSRKVGCDRLFLYLWDEPASGDFPEVLKRGRVSAQVDPRLRNLVTVPFTRKLGRGGANLGSAGQLPGTRNPAMRISASTLRRSRHIPARRNQARACGFISPAPATGATLWADRTSLAGRAT